MCGIFGYVGPKKNAASIVLTGLKKLEYRGYDSWGIAVIPDEGNKIAVKKKVGKIGSATVHNLPKGTIALGHTRWATHGGVTDVNAHPHLDCTGTMALIHNGIFENYEVVKKKLVKLGHHFKSETDTEVIVHLIEEYAKSHMFSKAVQLAFNDMEGLNAIIAISTKGRQLVAARNGSPLVVGFSDKENYLASDPAALLPYTKQMHFLEEDELAIVENDRIGLYNARTGTSVNPHKQHIDWSDEETQKGKYPNFMLKEIYDQPGVLVDIASNINTMYKCMARLIRTSDSLCFVGCGSASYTCLAGTYLMSKIGGKRTHWAVGSEFGYLEQFVTPKSLLMALSQSGETMDTLLAVKAAKKKGASVCAMVNVVGSSLYRLADYRISIDAGPERAVASTKAVTAKLAHLILLAYAYAGDLPKGQKLIVQTAKLCKELMQEQNTKTIQMLAKKISGTSHIYVIGRGISYAVCLETALKIKEISYIHAEGFAAGELKHGVLALVEKGSPCIAFLPNDETYSDNLAGAMEMKARGGYIIGISYKPHSTFDYYIPVEDVGVATIIPNIIVGQLLAYYLTIEKGLDPDMPRNLAKSVTVK